MNRLGTLDLPDRLSPGVPRWVTILGVSLATLAAASIARFLLDRLLPGGAPFALVFPVIMVATLFARWQAGAITGLTSILYTWYFVYPITNSFAFANKQGEHAIVVVFLTAILTLVLTGAFNAATRHAMQERDRQIADRDLFLAEFEHRVKNNFAVVAGLLDMQRRRATDPATVAALGEALARIDSIARAHLHLYRSGDPGAVEMRAYLTDLCATLADALSLRGGIVLTCDAEDAAVPRDRAVSIGLVVNELVTNAAKHAFAGRERGKIGVTFRASAGGWTVTVADDGVGVAAAAAPSADGGLGSRLIRGFARQAGGALITDSDATGTRVTLDIAR